MGKGIKKEERTVTETVLAKARGVSIWSTGGGFAPR